MENLLVAMKEELNRRKNNEIIMPFDEKSFNDSKNALISYCQEKNYAFYDEFIFGVSLISFKMEQNGITYFFKVIGNSAENNFEFIANSAQQIETGDKELIKLYIKDNCPDSDYIDESNYIVTKVKQCIFKSPLNTETIEYIVTLLINKNKEAYEQAQSFALFSLELDSIFDED